MCDMLKLKDGGYHTGIIRDPVNNLLWQRASDHVVVEMNDGWFQGFPRTNVGWDFLYWDVYSGVGFIPSKGKIWNYVGGKSRFICEIYI